MKFQLFFLVALCLVAVALCAPSEDSNPIGGSPYGDYNGRPQDDSPIFLKKLLLKKLLFG